MPTYVCVLVSSCSGYVLCLSSTAEISAFGCKTLDSVKWLELSLSAKNTQAVTMDENDNTYIKEL